jgi:two-component system chemotaxis response regulator CheB
MSVPKYVVVIGASSGGLDAISELISQFRPNMDAAYFVVMHMAKKGVGDFLLYKIQPLTPLRCIIPRHGDPIETGTIYFAPANKHLLMDQERVIIGHGPEENRWRPSIDILFRSAAVSFNVYCVGIILTGYLSDGTAGMQAIKRCGGTTIVQDPNEAEIPDMPLSILENMEVDHCIGLNKIGVELAQILQIKSRLPVEIPADTRKEAEIGQRTATGMDHVSAIAQNSVYACPDCGGVLWEVNHDNPNMARYRCSTGHAYTEVELSIKQSEALESTLWVALRIMEERRNLMVKLENDYRNRGLPNMAKSYGDKVRDLEVHLSNLKDILFSTENDEEKKIAS